MPCRSDYMEPSLRQKYRQQVAQFLVYVLLQQGKVPPSEVEEASKTNYPVDDFTSALCQVIRDMSEEDRDRIVYNAKDRTSRKLADWWEDHQEVDSLRQED